MSNYPTPHNACNDPSKIAKTVLMPGDPLRAKFIADNFLTDVECFTSVRNVYGFTGYYKGRRISVMASGMGQPSIGIYSYELFAFYGVENIIRIGSAGSYCENLKIYDTVLVTEAFSESSYGKIAFGFKSHTLKSNKALNNRLIKYAEELNIPLKLVKTHSSDCFYNGFPNHWKELVAKEGVECVEMESYALFANAKYLGKKATCLLSISDEFLTNANTTALERQEAFKDMMLIALEMAE